MLGVTLVCGCIRPGGSSDGGTSVGTGRPDLAPDGGYGANPGSATGDGAAMIMVSTDAGANADGGAADSGKEYTRQPCVTVANAQGDGASNGPDINVEVVVQNVQIPWGLTWLPNGDMLFTERDKGTLRMVKGGALQSGALAQVDVAQISPLEELGDLGSEGGLLGVVLHPDFANNHMFYLYWTARKPDNSFVNRLGMFAMKEDYSSAALDHVILDDIPAGMHHQGGRMRIGPDGKLYVGVGAYEADLAQDPNQLPGKLLRLNLDGSVPSDNPTPGSYVYIMGIRNTQGYDWFDAQHLLMMEHGPTLIDKGPDVPLAKGYDEFNVFRVGENSGWPKVLGCNEAPGVTTPVIAWERSLPPGGATIYRGTAIPEWTGSFFTATLGLPEYPGEGQHLHRIQVSPDNPYVVQKREVFLKNAYGRLRTVAEGPDGFLYVTTSNCDSRGNTQLCSAGGDKILRIYGLK